MSDDSASYTITPMGDILYIALKGVWSIQTDLSYINELSILLDKRKGWDWGICVDMTNWELPQEVFNSPFKSKLFLSRGNQVGESWITKTPQQAQELLPFFEKCTFTPQRFDNLQDALTHLQDLGLKCPRCEEIENLN